MAILQVWDNEDQTIVRQIYRGWWNVEDYVQSFEQFIQLVYDQPHIVHRIADFRESEGLIGNLVGIARGLEDYLPSNAGMYVAVAPSYQTQTVLEVACKVAPNLYRNLHFVDNLRDARTVIWQYNQHASASA